MDYLNLANKYFNLLDKFDVSSEKIVSTLTSVGTILFQAQFEKELKKPKELMALDKEVAAKLLQSKQTVAKELRRLETIQQDIINLIGIKSK